MEKPVTSRQLLLSHLGLELDGLEAANETLRLQNLSLEGELEALRARLEELGAPVGKPLDELPAPPAPPEMPPELLAELPARQSPSGPDDKQFATLSSSAAQQEPAIVQISSMHDFKLWPLWSEARLSTMMAGNTSIITNCATAESLMGAAEHSSRTRYGDVVRERSLLQRLVVPPGSTRQVCWDLLSILCMFYDVVMFPMQVFPMGTSPTLTGIGLATSVFWTLDIFNSFVTGLQTDGILELRPRKIAWAYLRGTFWADFLLVAVDWLVFVSSASEPMEFVEVLRIAKWPRMLRVIRLLRAVRLIKLAGLLVRFADSIPVFFSERVLILINIINTMLFILVACHVVACGWYFVGTVDGVGEKGHYVASWVESVAQDYGAAYGYEPTLGYRYLTSLHWAVTQFTPASMEVVPHNSLERSYAIFTVLFALIVFSSFVSSITASMARARMMNADHHRLVDSVRRFILHHQLSLETGTRLHNFIRTQSLPVKKRGDVTELVLSRVPELLRQDLCQEMFLPALLRHPLFWHHGNFIKDKSMACICDTAMSERYVLDSDQLFTRGVQATHVYLRVTGDCRYVRGLTVIGSNVEITRETVIAEAVLWVPWTHQGVLIGRSSYECVALSAQLYRNVLVDSIALDYISVYARAFVSEVLLPCKELSDLCTDPDKALTMSQEAFSGCHAKSSARLRKMSRFFRHRLTPTRDWMGM